MNKKQKDILEELKTAMEAEEEYFTAYNLVPF
jgi:hypothetical protein